MDIKFYPKSNEKNLERAVQKYENIWNKEGKKIIKIIEKISELRFKKNELEACIYEGPSKSRPFLLRANYPFDVKKATLVHELCHRLLGDNGIFLRVKKSENLSLVIHKVIFLILYDIWSELWGVGFANKMIEVEIERGSIYEEAWNWALKFPYKEDRFKKFLEMIK